MKQCTDVSTLHWTTTIEEWQWMHHCIQCVNACNYGELWHGQKYIDLILSICGWIYRSANYAIASYCHVLLMYVWVYRLAGKRLMEFIIRLRWCIDLWWLGPIFGGLVMLFSSLSFPQHLYRWLQLLADHCCNRLMSDREKARLCPQNIISCLWEVWALLIKQLARAARIDCQDVVMSDWPGWRKKLNPVMALFWHIDIWFQNIRHIITSSHKKTQCFSWGGGCWSALGWVIIQASLFSRHCGQQAIWSDL